MAPATIGSSLKTFPQLSGTGTGSFGWICPACWANTGLEGIRAFGGEIGHC